MGLVDDCFWVCGLGKTGEKDVSRRKPNCLEAFGGDFPEKEKTLERAFGLIIGEDCVSKGSLCGEFVAEGGKLKCFVEERYWE